MGGVIKVLESPDTDPVTLADRVLSGRYEKPYVMDDGCSRTLYFSFAYVQSAMLINKPNALELAYTRKMMSFVLFEPQPHDILMLGLGGGSLAKFCHEHLPETNITVVEINPDVVAFRNEFKIPPDSERFRIVVGDAADYVAAGRQRFDVIVTDAFDRDGFATSVCNQAFYRNLQRSLTAKGLLVGNMTGRDEEKMVHLKMLGEVFGERTLAIPVGSNGNDNHVVMAFNEPAFEPCWPVVRNQAERLSETLGLDLLRFAGKFERSHQQAGSQRSRSLAR